MEQLDHRTPGVCTIRVTGPTKPLRCHLTPPGNKNTAMPALVTAVLSNTETEIRNVPNIRDIRELCGILTWIGLDCTHESGMLRTRPGKATKSTIPTELSSRLRGSVYALAVLARDFSSSRIGEIGGDVLSARTLEPHVRALAGYGVEMRHESRGWRLIGGPARPGEFTLGDRPAGISASCLALLLGAALEGRSVIHGASQELEVRDLIDCVNALGGAVCYDGGALIVEGPVGRPSASWSIPGDHIYCGTLAMAAVMTGGDARLPCGMVDRMPSILKVMEETGVECTSDKGGLCLRGRARRAATLKTAPFPGLPSDVVPQMAALLTQAHGTSLLLDQINPLRFAHIEGLRGLGADLQVDGISVTVTGPRRLTAAQVQGAGIRETAALVLASLVAEGTTVIVEAQSLFRGYEDLPRDLASMGAVVNTTWITPPHSEKAQEMS